MRGTAASRHCRVKTGTLRGVSALAGYCATAGGREVGFALLMNRVNIHGAQVLQDRIATAIARLDEADEDAPPSDPGGTVPRPRVAYGSNASSPASSSTGTPSRSAFSSFEPGVAPATT
jgi:hypothetical protein